MTKDAIEACMSAMRLTRTQSWDESVSGGPRDEVDDPQRAVFDRELKDVLADCIELLPQQERLTVTLYYLEDLRLKEIGKVLGLSESRVSRILTNAENRLRGLITSKTA